MKTDALVYSLRWISNDRQVNDHYELFGLSHAGLLVKLFSHYRGEPNQQ